MSRALEVIEGYARRNAGNAWAQRLSRMKTQEAVPGEPSRLQATRRVVVEGWVPSVGEACLHVGAAGRARVVTFAALDGRFARVVADGEFGEWVLLSDLSPLVGA